MYDPVSGEPRREARDTPPARPPVDRPTERIPLDPAFAERSREPYVIRLPHSAPEPYRARHVRLPLKREPAPQRRVRAPRLPALAVAAMIPALAVAAVVGLAAALALLTARDEVDGVEARRAPAATTGAVLGVSTAMTPRQRPARRPNAAPRTPARRSAPQAARTANRLGVVRAGARRVSLLPVPPPARLAALKGTYVFARNARVQSVVGDEAFWIGGGGVNRLLVHIQENGGESRAQIRRGSRVSFVGSMAPNRPGIAAEYGLVASEGARLLRRQGVHVEVLPKELRARR